jgi:pimeloyl-ACP methyl ester carboxylesterase
MLQRTLRSFRRHLLNRMVLRPSQHPIQVSHQERVMLQCESHQIECFVQQSTQDSEPPDLLVLKFPGTAGRAERSTTFPISMLDVPRTAVWTWNPPGYGGSAGQASLSTMASAASAFWKRITEEHVGPETSVWLCGNSLGCTTALHIAATAQPDRSRTGLILRNPPPLRRVLKHAASPYPHFGLINRVIADLSDSMDSMLTARHVDLHAVVLQSELDTLVPIEFQNELLAVYAGQCRTVLMEGLDHDGLTTDQHETRINDSIQWLWEHTGPNKRVFSNK